MGNHLLNELSPYLQQHAYNPVQWYPWGEEAFRKADQENKVVIISIGYSSCHWCHVMEEESFEDKDVAALMNEHFISIKVDREERPDVDAHYMNSLQIISGRGGWPMNIFALPDGRAFYGGTYFPKSHWMEILKQVHSRYQNESEALIQNAEAVEKGIKNYQQQLITENPKGSIDLESSLNHRISALDNQHGGLKGTQKFPMPFLYHFLLMYTEKFNNTALRENLFLTLDRMISGGLYDQLGGGFSRYSTDTAWKLPHFEKMLYDNAQLISLYSAAYQMTGDSQYERIVRESIEFIIDSMTSPVGVFYSALDADSEGEEGAYYLWDLQSLKDILGPEYEFAAGIFGIGNNIYPENGQIILGYNGSNSLNDFDRSRISALRERLFQERSKRIPPALDDKSLTDWNALMISAFCDAYRALKDPEYLVKAETAAQFILNTLMESPESLKHVYKDGRTYIEGFLSDYALTVSALINLFELTGDEIYLTNALSLQKVQTERFRDEHTGFYYSSINVDSETGTDAVMAGFEIIDTVIPSANAVSGMNLFRLYKLTGNETFRNQYKTLLAGIEEQLQNNPLYFSHWGELALLDSEPFYEIVVCGPDAEETAMELRGKYLPHTITVFTTRANEESGLYRGRFKDGETLIYVCRDNSCLLPVKSVDDVLELIKKDGLSEF